MLVLGFGWVRGREGVSDEMGGVTDGKVLAFGGVEVNSKRAQGYSSK